MDKRSYNKRQVGTEKENLAAEYLKKKGYFIIEKNYRVRQGEIDLIANLDCVVSMDSLVMHLASLVATPVVSVWGATHPGLGFFGYGCDPRGIVQADMECRPCSVFGNKPCRYGDYRCLHAVTPAMIVERVEEIVGK